MPKPSWEELAIKRYGSVEAGRQAMREMAKKSPRNTGKSTYFSHLKKTDPEKFKQITSRGGKHGKTDVAADSGPT